MPVYAAVEATTDGYPPSDWPPVWPWPGDEDGPWPPHWPKSIVDDDDYPYDLDVTAPDAIYRGEAATVEMEVLASDEGSTDGLAGHRLKVTASIGGSTVNVKKSASDDYSTAVYYNILNYSGSQYGISEDIYFEAEPEDGGEELTITGLVTSVSQTVSGTDTVDVTACAIEFTTEPSSASRDTNFTIALKITNGNDVTQTDLAPETALTLNDAHASDELDDVLVEADDWSSGTYSDAAMQISGGTGATTGVTITASADDYTSGTTSEFAVDAVMSFLDKLRDISAIGVTSTVAYSSGYLYASDSYGNVNSTAVINVSDPSDISVSGYVSNASFEGARAIAADSTHAYVLTNTPGVTGGVITVDITVKESPSLDGSVLNDLLKDYMHIGFYPSREMVISGNYLMAHVGSNQGGTAGRLVAIDISDPSNPYIESYHENGALLNARSMAVSGDTAFISVLEDSSPVVSPKLCSVNIADKSTMLYLDTLDLSDSNTEGAQVALYGDYAYVASEEGKYIQVCDVSNPSSMSYVKTVTSTRSASSDWFGLFVSGAYMFIATTNYIQKYSLADPADPSYDSELYLSANYAICQWVANGSVAYGGGYVGGDSSSVITVNLAI